MKKTKSILIACALTCACLAQSSSVAFADGGSSVFNTKDVASLVKEVQSQPVVADKGASSVVKKAKVKSIKNIFSGISTLASSGDSSSKATTKSGTYPSRKGVIIVTNDAYKNLIPTGHAGIVYNQSTCIESLSDGVQFGKNDFNTRYTTCYACTVKGTSAAQDASTVDYIINKKWVGKPYNYNYLNVKTRDKFYCSQLVWASFKDNLNIDLDTSKFGNAVHPIELVDTDKTMTIYSQK